MMRKNNSLQAEPRNDDLLMHAPEEEEEDVVRPGAFHVALPALRRNRRHLMHAPEEDSYVPSMTLEPTRVETPMVAGELVPEATTIESRTQQQESRDEEERRKDRRSIWICSILAVALVTLGIILGVTMGRRKDSSANVVLVAPQPAPAPETSAPSQSVASRIKLYSPWTSFSDANSSQSLALEWIETDEYSLSIESEPLFMQRFALAVFYFTMNGPLSWSKYFLADGDECTYLPCDEEGFVVAINITFDVPARRVKGTFPPEMALLSRLTHFDPSWPIHWVGSLPTTIGLMTALQILGLSQISTDDPPQSNERLPSEIGNAVSLERLDLTFFHFDLPLPSELWQLTKLTYLRVGVMEGGQSFAYPSEVGQLTALKFLYMHTGLSGTIPTELGQLSLLEFMGFEWNVRGTLPSELGSLTNLLSLSITSPATNLVGTFPTEIWRLTQLRLLRLIRRGGLSGLFGKLPSEVALMTSLSGLEVPISGQIPSEIGMLTKLSDLTFQGGADTPVSQLPSEVGLLPNMEDSSLLDVLSGTIPSEIGKMTSLVRLSVKGNKKELTGPIPSELFGMTSNLQLMDFSHNNFQSSIPSEIGLLADNDGLFLGFAGSNLTGTIPTEVGELRLLNVLFLADNPNLTGELPDMRRISSLNRLELQGTGLSAPIDCSNFIRRRQLTLSVDNRHVAPNFGDCKPNITSFCELLC